jgi:hypothetical protein
VIRIALCLLLGGCGVVEHVQVVPVIDQRTQALSCCIAYVEGKSADGSIEVQNSEIKGVSVKLGARWKF